MAGNLLMSFLNKIELLDEYEYAENFIGCMLSPVITGIKPASTITLKNCRRKLYNYWNENGCNILGRYNLESITLQETEEGIVLLVYDRSNLSEHLRLEKNHKLLCEFGYNNNFQLERCLNCLRERIVNGSFPHESGIFLGIPYEDVIGFINGDKCLFNGYWKVYTNNYDHREIFSLYDESKKVYILNILENRKNKVKNLYVNHKQLLYECNS
ncbi:DUF3793 family protein [Tissierella carlieri]|uniref:DUF3793 family protein n=1 Tax=Tissierella carlieri TaxID=689904 RepID=A0ABT1SAH9_9FIRM|nr:DUF3793 family protein [Tissierella carlieri]MBU5312914.1 DUF3793 family protein [Tissierella carlieri]MCQ4923464.1 DUF3793 family protein [Tissierella carlieri]